MSYYAIEDKNAYTGFHCGALGSLDVSKREEEVKRKASCYGFYDRYTRLLDRAFGLDVHTTDSRSACKASPGSSLNDCLLRSTAQELRRIASIARISIPSKSKKADIVKILEDGLPKQVDRFDEVVSHLNLQALSVVERVLKGEFVETGRYLCEGGMGSFPFAFLCGRDGKAIWHMPQELREAFANVDVHKYSEHLEMRASVSQLILTHTVLGGITPVQEVLDSYKQTLPEDSFDEGQFMRVVHELTRDCWGMYRRWEHEDVTYIVLAAFPVYENNAVRYYRADGYAGDYRLESMWDTELYASLVPLHKQSSPRAVMDDLLNKPVSEYVYGLPCVQALVSYFDRHVPECEGEYTFADRMVDELICNFMFRHHTLAAELQRLTRQGWYLAEGFNAAPLLTSLVVGLYRGLPRWEFNGWSEVEYIDMQGYPRLIGESLLAGDEFALAS